MIRVILAMAFCAYMCSGESGDSVDMTCTKDTSYSDWNDNLDIYKNYYFLSGQQSQTKRKWFKTDRQFKWDYCKPTLETNPVVGSAEWLTQTDLKDDWTRQCSSSNAAIFRAKSSYKNKLSKQDREWDFYCVELDDTKFVLDECTWSGNVNGYGDSLDYICPSNGLLTGITSKYDKSVSIGGDRKWNFRCCVIKEVITYPTLSCVDDADYVALGTGENSTTIPSYFVQNQEFYYDESEGSIMMKWRYCQVDGEEAIATVEEISKSSINATNTTGAIWGATCAQLNDGNAAIIGDLIELNDGVPEHNRFSCGTLDTQYYALTDCEDSIVADATDSTPVGVECPNDGVFRTIAYTINTDSANSWEFECCIIENVVQYSAGSVYSRWDYFTGIGTGTGYEVKAEYVYALGVVLCLVIVANIGFMIQSRKSKGYKVVSVQSTDEEKEYV